ncbi:MAG: nickel/cobalt efflux transporter RcnA [Paludibacterium sp.]|uniref:nickel/cobalt efflux transporter n=1 Tax=Paludibacterium sp. TaxID=1917523 RepID=UPI0025ECA501|nr:nickel/cobalt efflux transporter [Paludibacterium sp.]MBV8046934.1 nickel/cobalt efflux transporter RcnA [Paludibacterium sp.]MBV8646527.1 nickel/cobalt efflux transporter RcnA [Paludibacterium sp.]
MLNFSQMLLGGNAWLFVPSAILLGALHGLEPGHSKTMMAAFIVAIRGTVGQAILLGLSATLSHTAVVWLVAMLGLRFGGRWATEASEPYFQVLSAAMILLVAGWMLWRTWREQHGHGHDHPHAHPHPHDHGRHSHRHTQPARHAGVGKYRSVTAQDALATFERIVGHAQDAHERAHAEDIRRRFANREASTGQIVLFGLTGGLVPCPASITVLLLCLQLKKVALGATLVLCFSIGLALTMVATGVLAALSLKHLSDRWRGAGEFARKAPYFSGALIVLVGLSVGYAGLRQLL